MKPGLGPRCPVEHLDRHHRERRVQPVEVQERRRALDRARRQEGDEGQRADRDDRRRFTDGARQADDGAGQDARAGRGKDIAPDHLPRSGYPTALYASTPLLKGQSQQSGDI